MHYIHQRVNYTIAGTLFSIKKLDRYGRPLYSKAEEAKLAKIQLKIFNFALSKTDISNLIQVAWFQR